MPKLHSEPTDDLLLTARDTTVVTQATAANDTFPAPYGDQQDEEAVFAGLAGAPARRSAPTAVKGVVRERKPVTSGFLPGMGGDLGEVKTARRMAAPGDRRLAGPRPQAIRMAKASGGFLPGLGEDDADADNVDGLGAAPARLKPKVRRVAGPAASAPRAVRPTGGFLPGMGELNLFGLGTVGTLALVGLGAYFLLRKR